MRAFIESNEWDHSINKHGMTIFDEKAWNTFPASIWALIRVIIKTTIISAIELLMHLEIQSLEFMKVIKPETYHGESTHCLLCYL